MLGTRVVSGICLIALLLGVLCLDEWFAPWFPFWFVLVVAGPRGRGRRAGRPARSDELRPSGNTVLGGVMALVVANWMPHVSRPSGKRRRSASVVLRPDASRSHALVLAAA